MLALIGGVLWKQFGSGTWYTVAEVGPGLYAYRYSDDPLSSAGTVVADGPRTPDGTAVVASAGGLLSGGTVCPERPVVGRVAAPLAGPRPRLAALASECRCRLAGIHDSGLPLRRDRAAGRRLCRPAEVALVVGYECDPHGVVAPLVSPPAGDPAAAGFVRRLARRALGFHAPNVRKRLRRVKGNRTTLQALQVDLSQAAHSPAHSGAGGLAGNSEARPEEPEALESALGCVGRARA